ncbi:unnamed protein product [Staurois parvus]|uniref:Uncharacterized protein n=1 Tax=Staurois parvus TaxID=386267 RepID=A0ABN9DG27_9NEOB|nr:unnamed protein product [Staurois parvus]
MFSVYTIFFTPEDAPDHETHLDFRGGKQEKKILTQWTADIVQEMTRDCGYTTGNDQRLRT